MPRGAGSTFASSGLQVGQIENQPPLRNHDKCVSAEVFRRRFIASDQGPIDFHGLEAAPYRVKEATCQGQRAETGESFEALLAAGAASSAFGEPETLREHDREALSALIAYSREQRNPGQALIYARRLAALDLANAEARQLVEYLESETRR